MAEQTLIPLSGAQFEISAGDYRAVITELGAGLRGLEYQGQPAVTGYDPDQLPPAGAGQLLLPWPNRLDGGRYAFAGASYQLDLNEPARGNAIHGLTRWASWQATAQAPDVAQLGLNLCGRPGYPFCLELSARYQLAERSGLTVTIIARNAGHRPAPYAAGSHPYLTAGSTVIDGCELTLPASRWLAADDRGIPRGPAQDVSGTGYDFRAARRIGDTRLDHALTGLARDSDGRAWAWLAGQGRQVALWAGEGYRWLQVFTGDALDAAARRRALAIEPMTAPPNAFASGIDLITLEPGQSVSHSWGVQVLAG
ncbi:MAG TPA: aldose 1-epimerase family protein [Streptosporangiaceae bacterium]|jgi:aldose 1-epimerase